MSHLSQALQALAESRPGLTQVDLCKSSGTSQPQMSRYFKGTSMPSAESLERICKVLPEKDRAAIAAAYLRDLLPDSVQDLVQILSELPAEVEPGDFLSQLPIPRELRDDFIYLARAAVRHAEVADSIRATARILRGDRGGSGYGDPPAERVREDPPGTLILREELPASSSAPRAK